ncbi:MAG: hypothetical protein E7508_10815 [Ruminococcus sp.]|nr:hypothetical protein [Ruminococcus sp.]
MNATISNIKARCAQVAGKVSDSPLYKKAEKLAVTAGATVSSLGLMAVNASAEGEVSNAITTAISTDEIITNASPFIESAIMVLCAVGGIKLGMRFLRGSFH